MTSEHDMSGAERGKFFHPDRTMRVPVYLEEDVVSLLIDRAAEDGVDIERLVNDLLKEHLERHPVSD